MKRLGFSKVMRPIRGMMLRYMPLMITCRQFEDFLIDYLEGELPDRQKFVFELHLKVCRSCRDYMAAYKRAAEVSTAVLSGDDAELDLPPLPEDLIKAVVDAQNPGA